MGCGGTKQRQAQPYRPPGAYNQSIQAANQAHMIPSSKAYIPPDQSANAAIVKTPTEVLVQQQKATHHKPQKSADAVTPTQGVVAKGSGGGLTSGHSPAGKTGTSGTVATSKAVDPVASTSKSTYSPPAHSTADQSQKRTAGAMSMDVNRKAEITFPEGFVPAFGALEAIRDCELPGVSHRDYIAQQADAIADDRLQSLPPGAARLSKDQMLGLVAYTFDLGLMSEKEGGEDNLYCVLNAHLVQRAPALAQPHTKSLLWHLMGGLNSLPPYKEPVYRGIGKALHNNMKSLYIMGKQVHWSGFTSTSTQRETAEKFAGDGGVLFIIHLVNQGRLIANYSAFSAENEVLLSPNFQAVVTAANDVGERLEIEMTEIAGKIRY